MNRLPIEFEILILSLFSYRYCKNKPYPKSRFCRGVPGLCSEQLLCARCYCGGWGVVLPVSAVLMVVASLRL